MRSGLVILACVGLALAARHPGFKDNTEYVYTVKGRTLTSLHDLSDQYSGIFLNAKLHVVSLSDAKLQARLSNAQYAQIHTEMPGGWDSQLSEGRLNFKPLDLSRKPFNILISDGLIKGIVVEKDVTNWEANMIKSIVSQLQLDLHGKNLIQSQMNDLPTLEHLDAVYKTREETVTGETETYYDIHRLPEYLLQSQPWLAPQQHLKGNGKIYEIIKSKNFTNGNDTPMFHFGLGEASDSPASNQIGDFFTRHSSSRVILSGDLSKFTIQSSNTVNKIIINPTVLSNEKASVVSSLNLTLTEVKSQGQQPKALVAPVEIGNLVYTFESPFASSNEVRQKQQSSDVDYESSENQIENSWQRLRRSAEQMIRKTQPGSDSDEEIQHQSRPHMKDAPELPLLPYFAGYHGQSIKNNPDFDIKGKVQEMVNEISKDMEEPETILAQSTLNKYVMLCSLIRLMNQQEIREITQYIYRPNVEGKERLAWIVYRDAVAQAGTGPAFLNIEEWISSRKIFGEEAAEVIAVMARAVRVPTEEYVKRFYALTERSDVQNQERLNETALLSFTNLLYKVYINRWESHNNYPSHSFKQFVSKEGRDWIKIVVIPELAKKLERAISEADTHKVHIYIRALGNIGHKKILETFEPYLEGEKKASQFQRLLMVLFMDKLTSTYPEVARAVLYRIYQNIGEVPEIRVVAVYQLMRTNPPAEMLQRMAENTNTDPQEEVNAVIKSTIETASQLYGQESESMRKGALSAKPLLTKKEYSRLDSLNFLKQVIIKNMNIIFKNNLLLVGSEDSTLPKGGKYTLRGNVAGLKHYFVNIQGMISSVKELVNTLKMQTREYSEARRQKQQNSPSTEWSSEKIAETLQLPLGEKEQLEGFLYAEIEGMYNMWSFDKQTIEGLPDAIAALAREMNSERKIQYVKLRQMKEIAISMSTEMGLPFLYTLDVPTLIQFDSRINIPTSLNQVQKISANLKGCLTVSAKAHSHLTVLTPFDHQLYSAGVDKNLQFHVPVDVKVLVVPSIPSIKIEWNIVEEHRNARLFHYSTWPYTAKSDLMNMKPISMQYIKLQRSEDSSFDFVFGKKQTGLKFRAWGHQPHKSINLLKLASLWESEGLTGVVQYITDATALGHRELSLAIIPQESSSKKVVFDFGIQKQYKHQPQIQRSEQLWSLEEFSSKIQDDRQRRQQDLMMHLNAGINNAYSLSFDASVQFTGEEHFKHDLVVAFSKSNVSPKSGFAAFLRSKAQETVEMGLEIRAEIPNTNGLDLATSLNTEPKGKYEILWQQRENGQEVKVVRGVVNMSRSKTRQTLLRELPLYNVCKKEMQERNNQLYACQNMTIEANYLNDIKIKVQHENLPSQLLRKMGTLVELLRVGYYPMTEVKEVQLESRNEIELGVKFAPSNLRLVNVTFRANDEETKFFNISLNELAKTVLVPHPVFHLKSRLESYFKAQDNIRPTCVIDETAAQTFSNRTYPLSLGDGWTLVMQYIPGHARIDETRVQKASEQLRDQVENFVVLVREIAQQHKEIKIIFNTPTTEEKTVEVYMQVADSESVPFVFVDGQRVSFDGNNAVDFFNGFVEIYSLPNGEVKFEIQDWFYVIFDGVRVKVTPTTDKLYDSVIGLCGAFSKDMKEDFRTPNNYIVKSPQEFVRSFKLEGSRDLLQGQQGVRKVTPIYTNVVSSQDFSRKQSEEKRTSSNSMRLRSRYVELDDDICFTTIPQPECRSAARRTVTNMVPVHCINKTQTAYYFKNQIDQGGNPDFSNKVVSKTIELEIPQECY